MPQKNSSPLRRKGKRPNMGVPDSNFTVRLPQDIRRSLKEEARLSRLSEADIARRVLADALICKRQQCTELSCNAIAPEVEIIDVEAAKAAIVLGLKSIGMVVAGRERVFAVDLDDLHEVIEMKRLA